MFLYEGLHEISVKQIFIPSSRMKLIIPIKELRDSLHEDGMLNPIMVYEYPKPGLFIVISGSQRFKAIKELKWDKCICYVVPKENRSI